MNDLNPMTTEEMEAFLGIRCAQRLAHRTATEAGWYADPNPVTRARRTIAARSTLETFMAAKEAA